MGNLQAEIPVLCAEKRLDAILLYHMKLEKMQHYTGKRQHSFKCAELLLGIQKSTVG